jgi:hypothetical protein
MTRKDWTGKPSATENTGKGQVMRRTSLLAALVGLAAVAAVTPPASAMYHAELGRFLQRDPGFGGPTRVGAAGPALAGRFAPRNAFADLPPVGEDGLPLMAYPLDEYEDGLNLYEYGLSDPVGHADPTGLSSRRTKYWHLRGYGAEEIKAGLIEIQHSVIAVYLSKKVGVDYAPRAKKEKARKGKKKLSGLAWLIWGAKGYTDPWRIQLELDYSRTTERWQLCIRDTGSMKDPAGGEDISCACATEEDVAACIEAVAKEWTATKRKWKRGHDCREFVQAAESGGFREDGPFSEKGCCLGRCSD